MDWLTHYNGLRQSIESMVAQQDCRALQETFDVWANAGATDVMEYIDFQLEQLDCHE